MEQDRFEIILGEFTEDLGSITKLLNDLGEAVNELNNRVIRFEEKLNNQKPTNTSIDTKPIIDIVKKSGTDILVALAGQPKNIVRKFQILLFPEKDAKLFYRVVFSRWFLMLIIALFLVNVYQFSIHWSDNQKEIKLQQLENGRIQKAWNFLYNRQGKDSKQIKRLMDSAYARSI
ncbi:MAG TPA: hypothetical protein VM802_24395 [Chitinophaga sp.]|uniref:hypothetical protein n=1 Tax=Chitinophaga sp. TaxID=1869181 RepID=UPI002BF69863|nr:hypothetical protein [Chitinophaga sp.]HVI48031.1 hypothetical protein [Chitinophaga sp.]